MAHGIKHTLLLVALLVGMSAEAKITKHHPKIYGPTSSSDTLWNIALANKPKDVTMYQMMAAIYQANDHAFSDGNMHALKPQQKLLIPPAAFVRKINSQQAYNAIEKFNIAVPNKKAKAKKPSTPSSVPVSTKTRVPPSVLKTENDQDQRAKDLNAIAQKNDQSEPKIDDLDSLLEKTIEIGHNPHNPKQKKTGTENQSPEAKSLQQNLLKSQQALSNLENEDAGLAKQLGDLNVEMSLLIATLQQSK